MNNLCVRVAVCHPVKQHSHQLATALQKSGMLVLYLTGSPAVLSNLRFIPRSLFPGKSQVRLTSEIPPDKVIWLPLAIFFYFFKRVLSAFQFSYWFSNLGDWIADYIYSFVVPWNQIDAVVGYENACKNIFKLAKRKGKKRILDAASLSYLMQDQFFSYEEGTFLHRQVIQRKRAEIAFADAIIVPSELSKKSYEAVGFLTSKISVVHLGVDLKTFSFDDSFFFKNEKLFRFVFCGNNFNLKGLDVLIEAFQDVCLAYPDLQLLVIGNDSAGKFKGSDLAKVVFLGKKAPSEIRKIYSHSNCFVLPSRLDSFSMAVLEAMACGLPVIVSSCVGSKDLVVEDANGWVVPVDDVIALKARMKMCVENRDALRGMRPFCCETAKKNSWERYHVRVADVIQKICSAQ